jgi:hypothetical protein
LSERPHELFEGHFLFLTNDITEQRHSETIVMKVGDLDLEFPRVVFGTATLGNLFVDLPEETKLEISRQWFETGKAVVVDTAGKYGAGLALEVIGNNLRALKADPNQVIISNKLGWKRVPLTTDEPTFEPGAWLGLKNDAVQCISYDGILECWAQGNELLGEGYVCQFLSIHDPDEYLAAAILTITARVAFGSNGWTTFWRHTAHWGSCVIKVNAKPLVLVVKTGRRLPRSMNRSSSTG